MFDDPLTVALNCWVLDTVRVAVNGVRETVTPTGAPTAAPCSSKAIANRAGTDTARPEGVGRIVRKGRIAEELVPFKIDFMVNVSKTPITISVLSNEDSSAKPTYPNMYFVLRNLVATWLVEKRNTWPTDRGSRLRR
jgi:hypothetical protein